MRSTPEYNRETINVTFATSAATSTDNTLTEANLIHSILLIGHTWDPATAGASAASGAVLTILDENSNTIKAYAEVLTGSTALLSGDIMVFPNDIVRYQLTVTDGNTRCTSGQGVPTSQFPTATVILYKY
jgi:hypothetical protein